MWRACARSAPGRSPLPPPSWPPNPHSYPNPYPKQVLLYLLLMEERYGRPLDWGMLWYTGQPGAAPMSPSVWPLC